MLGILGAIVSFVVTNKTSVAILGAAGAWLWSKVQGKKTQSISDLATAFARQAVTELLNTPANQGKAADYIESKVIDGLATKLGLAPSLLQQYEPVIHPIVEHAVADLMDELAARALAATHLQQQITAQTDALATQTKNIADMFNPLAFAAREAARLKFADVVQRVDDQGNPVGADGKPIATSSKP